MQFKQQRQTKAAYWQRKFKSMGVQVCKRREQKKMELNANIQLVMNGFGTLFPDTFQIP